MTFLLTNHPQAYHLSNKDIAISTFSLTASPYAMRHRDIAREHSQNWLGHTVLCIVECIPVIGIIAAAIEYAISSILQQMRNNNREPSLIKNVTSISPSQELPPPCSKISPGSDKENTTVPPQEPISPPVISSPPAPARIYTDLCELREAAELFFNTYPFPDPLTFPTINTNQLTPKELLTRLLEEYQGICIGESYDSSAPTYFLIRNMSLLKELGVDTLYLEGFQGLQDELDAYFVGASRALPPALEARIERFSFPKARIGQFPSPDKHGFSKHLVLMAAKSVGIRMVNIDSNVGCYEYEYEYEYEYDSPTLFPIERSATMNYQAKLIIDQDREAHPGKKSIIYSGSAYTNGALNVPGFGQIYRFPSITVKDDRIDAEPPYFIEKETNFEVGYNKMNHDFLIHIPNL